eukprot:scaffold16043_cov115-Isochrysis_galbana.AAC.18
MDFVGVMCPIATQTRRGRCRLLQGHLRPGPCAHRIPLIGIRSLVRCSGVEMSLYRFAGFARCVVSACCSLSINVSCHCDRPAHCMTPVSMSRSTMLMFVRACCSPNTPLAL